MFEYRSESREIQKELHERQGVTEAVPRPVSKPAKRRSLDKSRLLPNYYPRSMFHKSAAYYDLIYRDAKDYAAEAAALHEILSAFAPPPRKLLDVGCGTGEHARQLASRYGYQVDGIDLEPSLIEIAAPKLPQADFTVADMRDFSLPSRYDALLCLFSSIAYVETLDSLEKAFAAMARHLRPKGWLICEPWQTPDNWQDGLFDATVATDPTNGLTVTRSRLGSTENDGKVSVLQIDYDIATPQGESTFSEVHRLGLFSENEMLAALEKAGFSARYADKGTRQNPVILANKII